MIAAKNGTRAVGRRNKREQPKSAACRQVTHQRRQSVLSPKILAERMAAFKEQMNRTNDRKVVVSGQAAPNRLRAKADVQAEEKQDGRFR